jgi:hypothetical protein
MEVDLNNHDSEEPYDRVAFYYSSELLITQLAKTNPKLPRYMGGLYAAMKNF